MADRKPFGSFVPDDQDAMTHWPATTSRADPYLRAIPQAVANRIIGMVNAATALPRLAAQGGLSNQALADPDALRQAARASWDTASHLAGASMTGAERDAFGMGIRAYHSSPKEFDQFDISKVRPGEGGLHFSDSERMAQNYKGRSGKTYETEINANPEDFVDWHDLTKEGWDDAASAARLANAPGFKYPAGGGTTNYVVMNDKLLNILKTYGMAGMAALPLAGAYHFQDGGSAAPSSSQ